MPKMKKSGSKIKSQASQSQKPQSRSNSADYEQDLIEKIGKCQRVVNELSGNAIWEEIKSDFEITAKGLDMSWAYVDGTGPQFKQMQASKMAVQTFMNLLESYKHDLDLAKKELSIFQSPEKTVKKDYDDEGIKGTQTISTIQGNAYHG